jgi:hypothetical protein
MEGKMKTYKTLWIIVPLITMTAGLFPAHAEPNQAFTVEPVLVVPEDLFPDDPCISSVPPTLQFDPPGIQKCTFSATPEFELKYSYTLPAECSGKKMNNRLFACQVSPADCGLPGEPEVTLDTSVKCDRNGNCLVTCKSEN